MFCSVLKIIFSFDFFLFEKFLLTSSKVSIKNLTNSLFGHIQCIYKPIKGIFHFCYSVFYFQNFLEIQFFSRIYTSQLILPIYSCMLSPFSIRDLIMLIILSDPLKISDIFASGSYGSFISSVCVFFLLASLVIFFFCG